MGLINCITSNLNSVLKNGPLLTLVSDVNSNIESTIFYINNQVLKSLLARTLDTIEQRVNQL